MGKVKNLRLSEELHYKLSLLKVEGKHKSMEELIKSLMEKQNAN